MAAIGSEIERLIQLLAKLPGLGPRSARRAALALLKKRDTLLEPLAKRQSGGLLPLLLGLVVCGSGVVLEESGTARFAQLAGLLAGVLGGCALVAWRHPHARSAPRAGEQRHCRAPRAQSARCA